MSKGHDSVHGIKYHRMIKHAEVVKFAEVLDFGNSSLVELEIVLLQTENNVFQNIVNDCDDEVLMIAVQSARENGKQMDVAVLDLSWLREDLL
jgi:hypothetical protein